MRLSDDQLRDALLHEEKFVRQYCLDYFTGSFSRDPSVMHNMLEAITRFGWSDAFRFYASLDHLALDEPAVEGILEFLSRRPLAEVQRWRETCGAFVEALLTAHPALLAPRAAAIETAVGITDSARESLDEWYELGETPIDDCWDELEQLCDAEESAEIDEDSYGRAELIAVRIALEGPSQSFRVHQWLAEPLTEMATAVEMARVELAAQLAGRLRMSTETDRLMELLGFGDDSLCEEVADALIRIGGDDVARGMSAAFHQDDWLAEWKSCHVLRHIRSDASTAAIRRLASSCNRVSIRTALGLALAGQFDADCLEEARRLTAAEEVSGDFDDLFLIAAAAELTGVENEEIAALRRKAVTYYDSEIPAWDELDWLEENEDADDESERERGWGWGGGGASPEYDADYAELPEFEDDFEPAQPIHREAAKVGRNEPCPCGSGKKFKKCCMRKGADLWMDD